MIHTLSKLEVKWCQDGKIATCLSWHCDLLATSRQLPANQSQTNRRLVASRFYAKVFMKLVSDRLVIDWRLFGVLSATNRRLLENFATSQQSKSVAASFL